MHFKISLVLLHLIHFPFSSLGNHSISIFISENDQKINPFSFNEKMNSQKLEANTSSNFHYNFDYIASNVTNITISEEDQNKSSDIAKRNFTLVFTFCAIALFIVLVNLRVFRIVTMETQQKNRSINILVAHLSFVAIGFTCVIFIYVMEKSNIFSLTAPGLCEFLSFLRNIILSLFPLNSVAITYVRTRHSLNDLSKTFLSLTFSLIWTVAVVGSLPSIFMVTYSKDLYTDLEKCKQFEIRKFLGRLEQQMIPLLGTFEATLAYEIFRFVLYHFLVCSYMAYAMITIRTRIRYLYINKPIPDRMKRRVQRVRFVYLHSIIFILIWLPTGLALFFYKLRTRVDWMADYIDMYLTPIVVLSSSLFILSPLVYVILHEETSTIVFKGLGICLRKCKGNESAATKEEADVQSECSLMKENKICTKSGKDKATKMIKRKIAHETTGDMSRISTVVLSGASDRSIILYTHIILRSSTQLKDGKFQTTMVRTCVHLGEQNVDVEIHEKLCEHFVMETMV